MIFSVHTLWNILPKDDLELWRNFILACLYLCSTVTTEAKAMLVHSHLLKFCKRFEELHGKERITPNMHLHTHLLDCITDYGPVYAFWLFSFEVCRTVYQLNMTTLFSKLSMPVAFLSALYKEVINGPMPSLYTHAVDLLLEII